MKAAFYLMTRNIYTDVVPSLKSLLKNGKIDRVYILAEDDDIGFELPAKVIVKNISGWKKRLNPEGPNIGCRWSYMVMMKILICQMFPKMDRALTIDVDTIVRGDLSPLWDVNLDGYYFAGAREPFWSQRYCRDYVNAGVIMWNLVRMRDGMADMIIDHMNRMKYTFVEQDCMNELCWDRIKIFDAAYNAGDWTERPQSEIRVRHYMASKGLWKTEPEVLKYAEMPWEEVF